MKKKMLVVDGNSILNRAFYGIRLLTNKNGLYTNAIYGMITILSRHIEQLKPDYCAVAFDLKAPTFRHKMYDGYKANRKGMPEELAAQMPYAKKCMTGMGMTVVTCEGYEADDILGTLASSIGSEETDVYVLTGDRDSLQLIDEHVSVLLVKTKETVLFDPRVFREEYGISPDHFVEVKALMGDSSDNIPGVAGIGEKTALKLIAEYGTIQELYNTLETAKLSEGVKKKLSEGRAMADLSLELAKICLEAPIDRDREAYAYNGVREAELRELFMELDFTGLLKKFGLDRVEETCAEPTVETRANETVQDVDSVEKLKQGVCAVSMSEERIFLFDGERLFSAEKEEAVKDGIWEALCARELVCFDYKKLFRYFYEKGKELPLCRFDCMLAAYVLDSGRSTYTMEDLCVRYLNTSKSEEEVDAVWSFRLYEVLKAEIEKLGFEKLLYEIEQPLAPVLGKMELSGFKIDSEGIERYGKELAEAAEYLQMRIYSYAGQEFNIGSPKQLGEILFEKMGLPKSKKTKTGYSTDAETLQKLASKHPIIEDILDYRQVTKLKSTYADGLIKAADGEGRVHSILNQTGTATGRLSSSEPNLQNIPVRTELGRKFRQFFVPKNSDYVLIDADYSQIELRLLAHVANDEAMIASFLSGEDIHTMTAARVFGVAPDQVSADLRKKAKAVNFGIMYGIGEYSLSEDLSITRAQAKEYIDSYFEKFPEIRSYLDRVKQEARELGYVTTIFGRRRYIPELASSNKNLQHFGERIAMNSPIQGTAADIIKIAMIRVDEELKRLCVDAELIMQVHDELLIECHKDDADKVKELLVGCMENAVDLLVPMSVEAHVGSTWFDAK